MNRTSLFLLVLGLGVATLLHASEPVTFQELSLMIRTGESPQEIINDVSRRRLLHPLAASEVESLQASGASPALVTALQNANLAASPDQIAAYQAHHRPQPLAAPAPVQTAPQGAPANPAAPAQPQAVVLPDRFTEGLEAAKTVPEQSVRLNAAFMLDQLADAKAQAVRDRKPIGFLMYAPSMLDKPATTRDTGSTGALLHFYQAFKDSLVLVFIPMDVKKNLLPPAVTAGIDAKEIGGVAPNMVVVDATTNALICAVPCGNAKTAGPDRDKIFAVAAAATQRWLTFHPMAIGTPQGPAAAVR